jgi:hypothetical protein
VGEKMKVTAIFSEDPKKSYRYTLYRIWNKKLPHVTIIGLNPSTADELHNDPTMTRCINFVNGWGYGGFVMVNLFAFRATDPRNMRKSDDPVGPENDRYIAEMCEGADKVIAAWGNGGLYKDRGWTVAVALKEKGIPLYCLGMTKDFEPLHPLFVPGNRSLEQLPETYYPTKDRGEFL